MYVHITYRAQVHGFPTSNLVDNRRRQPIEHGEHGVYDAQTRVSIARKRRVVFFNALQHHFLKTNF